MDDILCGDALTELRNLADESVNCCITSPPYWGLRDYGITGQLGLEPTPEEYVAKLVEIFREVKRILRKDGTLWLVLGDSYSQKTIGERTGGTLRKWKDGGRRNLEIGDNRNERISNIRDKNMVGIPWRVAFALQADGWYLRSDIIWSKPNPMPESVTDRPTKSHEYIFLLSKSAKYYFDQEAVKETSIDDESYTGRRKRNAPSMAKFDLKNLKNAGSILPDGTLKCGMIYPTRNIRSVWTITAKPFKEAHFATFPPEIPERCIKAGCPKGGVVLDPFLGAGTTGMVALNLGRDFIGIELSEKYCHMAKKRIYGELEGSNERKP